VLDCPDAAREFVVCELLLSPMAVEPVTRGFLQKMAERATKPRHEMTPTEARAALAELPKVIGRGPAVWRAQDLDIPADAALLPARLFLPSQDVRALLAYFHGGGWVVGSLAEFDPLCREIAVRSGCAVLAVAYRKAPEHPYPAPIDDAWAALQWIAGQQDALLGKPVPLLVGGDSAGANLTIAVTFRARAKSSPRIAAQLLVYPVTDYNLESPSYVDPENQLMLTRETMAWYWGHYVPDATKRREPEASPLRAADLSGLPPAIVVTAEHDVLRHEGEEYARRLREAGVPVSHRRFDGQMHGFLMMVELLPGSAIGLEYVSEMLRQILAKPKASAG
jgi:acetyl esterase